MSVNLTASWHLNCNGGRMGCKQIFEESSVCNARETRQAAKAEGWEVAVRGPYHRRGDRLLDFCPDHREGDAR